MWTRKNCCEKKPEFSRFVKFGVIIDAIISIARRNPALGDTFLNLWRENDCVMYAKSELQRAF
jgi:hypothetical protein